MRVAVSQFATSLNAQENLATCVRMINEMAVCKPNLIVLPEFCNSQPWYVDHNQAWNEALATDGTFIETIAQQAKKHACYIVLNVTLRRDVSPDLVNNGPNSSVKAKISVTSCLLTPLGELIHQADKQTLSAYENDFFISPHSHSENANNVVTTPIGKLGFLIGKDDMAFEASRELALNGAQLLCHSNSSYTLDQSHINGPTRACENKVFLASANKIGPLLSQGQITTLLEQSATSQGCLVGVGQSQIVSPEGKLLAKIANNKEGFAFADIDLTKCGINHKQRPDGTDLIKQLRPELYQALTPAKLQVGEYSLENEAGKVQSTEGVPVTANVAIFATYKSNEQAIEDVCHYIENNLSDIIQLPELFFIADKAITNDAQQLTEIACLSKQLIEQVSSVLRPFQYLCTSLVIEGMHQAVIISEHGLFAQQQQLHFCQRYQWTILGDEINIIELPLEQGNIKLAMLTADDANIPEIVKLAALNDIHLLLVPFDIQTPCEVEYGLLSRATENRICIVAASREKSFANTLSLDNDNENNIYIKNKVKSQKSTGLIINLTTDSALLPQWKSRKFDGYINQPLVKHQYGKITKAVIHPIAACTKLMTRKVAG